MYTFVWFSGAIWETPSKKTAVILSHLYVIGVKIVLRAIVHLETDSNIFFFIFLLICHKFTMILPFP